MKQAFDEKCNEYLTSVIESSPVALISLNTLLRITMFNRTAQNLTGWSSLDVAGCRITKILGFKRTRNILRTLRGRDEFSINGYITMLRGRNGEEIPVRLKISPLTGSGDELLGAMLLATDLREIKQFQAKLLEEERLTAISETAISVNHEINNPLCSILGNTQLILMEKERLDPATIKKLRAIEKQIARIQEISERLGRITKPVLKEYIGGKKMLDVEQSVTSDEEAEEMNKKVLTKNKK